MKNRKQKLLNALYKTRYPKINIAKAMNENTTDLTLSNFDVLDTKRYHTVEWKLVDCLQKLKNLQSLNFPNVQELPYENKQIFQNNHNLSLLTTNNSQSSRTEFSNFDAPQPYDFRIKLRERVFELLNRYRFKPNEVDHRLYYEGEPLYFYRALKRMNE